MVAQHECTQYHGTGNLKMVKTVKVTLYVFYHNIKENLEIRPPIPNTYITVRKKIEYAYCLLFYLKICSTT